MFNKTHVLVFTGMCSMLAFGCDRASQEHEDAVKAQAAANEDIAEANKEARDEVVSAQAEADKKIAEAQKNFTQLREDFRHETTNELAEIDKEIAELEAESMKLSGPEKTQRDAKLTRIHSMREQFTRDYEAIETASATTWDRTKAQLEKQLKAIDEAIDDAG
jgi:hypothetical protein